ncbi:MAG TPA: phosphatidate cytidylyltransferase [Acidimicrobiales bacterium]|jgi:CDP-diglyceride synthetase|nr:phosphatidate cytidylyltransferase [Acidimicrobiales bacterium]
MTDVDDVPERREDEATSVDPAAPRRETTGPATERVRIVGAEPAGEITSELPVVSAEADEEMEAHGPASGPDSQTEPEGYGTGQPMVRLTDEPAETAGTGPTVEPVTPGQTAVPAATPTELPHWTEPPTGQVPAVLARDPGDEAAEPGMAAPSWREEDADWVAHDDQFEPSMFGSDQVALGSLDESDRSDAERRPWEFDLDSARPGSPSPVRRPLSGDDPAADSPITEETEVVAPESAAPRAVAPETVVLPAAAARSATVGPGEPVAPPGPDEPQDRPGDAGFGAGEATGDLSAGGLPSGGAERLAGAAPTLPPADVPADAEEVPPGPKRRPTGTARHGRSRRNGLRPTRLRAKKPEEVELTDAPLAAEPPGASVTDVPGAGRRRGLAGLAAADRTAERQDDELAGVGGEAGDTDGGRRRSRSAVAAVGVAAGATKRRLARRPSEGSPRQPGRGGVEAATGGGPPAPRRAGPEQDAGTPPGPHEDSSSIGVRVGTGLAAAVVALLAFKVGTVASLVLSTVVVTFAAGECFGVLRRAGYHPATLLGLVGTVSLMVGAYTKGVAALPLILVLLTVFTFIWYLFGIERGSPVAGTAATLLTVGWVSVLGSYAGLLLAPSAFPDRHGIAFLLGAIIATVANDIGALVIGGWLGSRPLAPNISPNKTWEGLFGGAVFSILVSTVVVGSIHPWSASNAALLGVVVAVVAPLGDLCESLLKRDLRLKDMGSLLPGHGGILDRVDALLFVLPATYYLVRALNIA